MVAPLLGNIVGGAGIGDDAGSETPGLGPVSANQGLERFRRSSLSVLDDGALGTRQSPAAAASLYRLSDRFLACPVADHHLLYDANNVGVAPCRSASGESPCGCRGFRPPLPLTLVPKRTSALRRATEIVSLRT
jgi:hypothetical protein